MWAGVGIDVPTIGDWFHITLTNTKVLQITSDSSGPEDLVYGGELSAEAVQRLFLPNQQKVWQMVRVSSATSCNHGHIHTYHT